VLCKSGPEWGTCSGGSREPAASITRCSSLSDCIDGVGHQNSVRRLRMPLLTKTEATDSGGAPAGMARKSGSDGL
jgi:hypothetical protein